MLTVSDVCAIGIRIIFVATTLCDGRRRYVFLPQCYFFSIRIGLISKSDYAFFIYAAINVSMNSACKKNADHECCDNTIFYSVVFHHTNLTANFLILLLILLDQHDQLNFQPQHYWLLCYWDCSMLQQPVLFFD